MHDGKTAQGGFHHEVGRHAHRIIALDRHDPVPHERRHAPPRHDPQIGELLPRIGTEEPLEIQEQSRQDR
ncbi:MAG: hypothetical protein ACREMJ_00380 [Gemmatimonadales bacterium]